MRQIKNVRMNLCQYQINKVASCKIPKARPRTYIKLKGVFSGLIFCAAYIRTFGFSNVKTKKILS